jgi:Ni/Co efflux regulator RcnB
MDINLLVLHLNNLLFLHLNIRHTNVMKEKMKGHFTARNLFRRVFIPVLALSISTGVARAQGHGSDHDHYDNHDNHDNHHGQDFHFRDEDRGHFVQHYQKDVDRWRHNPHGRPHFVRGERIPGSYRFQPVPRAYYSEVPPPPPGYQYGYYDGYVVAYDPTTRVVADVLDLVGAAFNR